MRLDVWEHFMYFNARPSAYQTWLGDILFGIPIHYNNTPHFAQLMSILMQVPTVVLLKAVELPGGEHHAFVLTFC